LEKLSPIEQIVKKIIDQEQSLEDVYQKLDEDGDGVLSPKEITKGLSNPDVIGIVLDPSEIDQIQQALDDNTDGIVTRDEFLKNLKNPYEKRKNYQKLMGSINVDNPIVLEERMLDMKFRKP